MSETSRNGWWIAICAGSLTLALAVADPVTGAAETDASRDDLIRQSLDELHAENFDRALSTAGVLRERWPASAAGHLAAANVFQTRMRDFRVRGLEANFRSSVGSALALADHEVRTQPSAAAFFARGTLVARLEHVRSNARFLSVEAATRCRPCTTSRANTPRPCA